MPDYIKILLFILSQLPVLGGVLFVTTQAVQNRFIYFLVFATYEILVFIVAFSRKVWGKLEDKLVAWFARKTEDAVNHPLFRRRYKEQVISDYAPFNVKGLDSINPLKFEHVFVELRIESGSPHEGTNRLLRQADEEELKGNHSILEFIKQFQSPRHDSFALTIVGSPGSGKTTLLQNIALTLAADQHKKHGINAYMPIMLFLREHVGAIVQERPPLHQLLQKHFGHHPTLNPPETFFADQLKEGSCLILLDGLDEVAQIEERKVVSEWADEQIKNYRRCRFILTSRPQGYKVKPLTRARVLETMPFNAEQVQKFIENWYLAHMVMKTGKLEASARQEAINKAHELMKRLRAMPSLNEMTVNPLLLTMIVIAHDYYGALPGSREKLYAALCDVLLERRNAAKDVPVKFSANQCLTVLRPLAAYMMENRMRDIGFDDMLSAIASPLESAGIEEQNAASFPSDLELASGILQEMESKRWSFAHLSFQEYLSAMHWLQQPSLQHDWQAMVGDSWWYETLRFYAAKADDADPIAKSCLKANTPQALTLLADLVKRDNSNVGSTKGA